MENEFKKKVEELLKKNKEGLTIQDISELLKITRTTVSIALAELRGENRIEIREVGNAKLHYLK